MTHYEHCALIRNGVGDGKIWVDLGSGDGAFTLALRDIVGVDAEIYSLDKDAHRLETQHRIFDQQFPNSNITYLHQDFTHEMPLPPLDGILMANSLHYVEDQSAYINSIKKYLKPHGKLLLVEYNNSDGNEYVPYALSYEDFEKLAEETGFTPPKFLHRVPSHFLKEIYAAVASLK